MEMMAKWHKIVFWVIVLLFVSLSAHADHEKILDGKVVIGGGECSFNKYGEMIQGGEVKKLCLLAIDPGDDRYAYAIIHDERGAVLEVVRMDTQEKKNESVWKPQVKGMTPI